MQSLNKGPHSALALTCDSTLHVYTVHHSRTKYLVQNLKGVTYSITLTTQAHVHAHTQTHTLSIHTHHTHVCSSSPCTHVFAHHLHVHTPHFHHNRIVQMPQNIVMYSALVMNQCWHHDHRKSSLMVYAGFSFPLHVKGPDT